MTGKPPNGGELERAVETRRRRQRHWHEEGERPLARNLAMIGSLGWLIVAPILGGIVIGRWLDAALATGITFTAALIVAGAAAGFWLAWQRMHRE